jgi:hypothetical protein
LTPRVFATFKAAFVRAEIMPASRSATTAISSMNWRACRPLHLDWLLHGLQRRDQPKVSIHHHEHAFHAPVLTQHDGPFSAVLIQKAYTGLSGLDGMI